MKVSHVFVFDVEIYETMTLLKMRIHWILQDVTKNDIYSPRS